jgi:hypothetical protein
MQGKPRRKKEALIQRHRDSLERLARVRGCSGALPRGLAVFPAVSYNALRRSSGIPQSWKGLTWRPIGKGLRLSLANGGPEPGFSKGTLGPGPAETPLPKVDSQEEQARKV